MVLLSAAQAEAAVYWANRGNGTIGRANPDGSGISPRLLSGGTGSCDVAAGSRYLYWDGSQSGGIGRAGLDGSGPEPQFIKSTPPYCVIAVDRAHIYWSNVNDDVIGRAKLDGSDPNPSFINLFPAATGGDNAAVSLAVDGAHLYWINYNSDGVAPVTSVGRANLDGSDVRPAFVNTGASAGGDQGIAVDGAHVYWTNQFENTIGRANIDGTGADPGFIGGAHQPMDVAVDGSYIYWSNYAANSIGRADLSGANVKQSFITGAASPWGMASTTSVSSGTRPGVNHPPIARPEHWRVKPGGTVEGNVLANDHDPDGDPIRAKVVRISFARQEWSGLEAGGTFLYTAGPGTARTLHKKITYVAVDSHGARSKPVTSEVTLVVLKPAKPPVRRGVSRAARRTPDGPAASTAQQVCANTTASPCWYPGGYGSYETCFGSGVHTQCWVLFSTLETQALNLTTPWLKKPSFSDLFHACFKLNPKNITAKNCAQGIAGQEFNRLWNKGTIQAAASSGYCLAFRLSRHRTLRHPLAGVWGDPEYSQLYSGVPPWRNDSVSGWVYWSHGLTGRIKVPLFCNTDGQVWLYWPAHVIPA